MTGKMSMAPSARPTHRLGNSQIEYFGVSPVPITEEVIYTWESVVRGLQFQPPDLFVRVEFGDFEAPLESGAVGQELEKASANGNGQQTLLPWTGPAAIPRQPQHRCIFEQPFFLGHAD